MRKSQGSHRWLRLCCMLAIGVGASISLPGSGCGVDTPTPTPFDHTTATYVGKAVCAGCHATIAAKFANNGHGYKLNKVSGATAPTYPHTSLTSPTDVLAGVTDDDAVDDGVADPGAGTDNTLGTPSGWADVSYVIGGFGWKARFIDANGYIITGSAVQYNFETDGYAGYHNNETDKVYNCGNCHTTGWKHYDATNNPNRQDDLDGMDGTFYAPGVECEACHGAGSAHVAGAGDTSKITKTAIARTTADFTASHMGYGMPVACSECHTRNGEKDYPDYLGGDGTIAASGGLIKHHEQYDELQGIDPDDVASGATGPHKGLACTDCHDPHTTIKHAATSGDGTGLVKTCTDCHTGVSITGGMAALDCTDCHMPLLAKSAVKHDAVGTGPITGDIHSHIFRIDTTATSQFTSDGTKAYPWITADWACRTCHNGTTASEKTDAVLQAWTHGT